MSSIRNDQEVKYKTLARRIVRYARLINLAAPKEIINKEEELISNAKCDICEINNELWSQYIIKEIFYSLNRALLPSCETCVTFLSCPEVKETDGEDVVSFPYHPGGPQCPNYISKASPVDLKKHKDLLPVIETIVPFQLIGLNELLDSIYLARTPAVGLLS